MSAKRFRRRCFFVATEEYSPTEKLRKPRRSLAFIALLFREYGSEAVPHWGQEWLLTSSHTSMSEGGRRWTASRSVIASPNQPAQSPDLNCLDLGLLASIQSVQSRTTSRTIQDIIQEVEHAYETMTAETLNKTFLTLQLVMKEIMNCEGRNDYKLAHFHKDKLIRAGNFQHRCSAILQVSALRSNLSWRSQLLRGSIRHFRKLLLSLLRALPRSIAYTF
ncbi:hypothetical protein F444_22679 [Phytophthora nicotianae P1976]|uniref:Uncharacterized protein n=1 Tax=Phytophthora nicotianae P1976 TaxID=1317066 RepID=A0A080YX31_PHYNI|nr:hypothetical protein F444_22679 [Phytophthora nicotianae P1976]